MGERTKKESPLILVVFENHQDELQVFPHGWDQDGTDWAWRTELEAVSPATSLGYF